MNTLLFAYGTLKRGCSNHAQMAGQTFLGPAQTVPGFRLYNVGGYPGLVIKPDDPGSVIGEVWSVDPEGLQRLDVFEGVQEGLYRRERVPLLRPFADRAVEAYVYPHSITGRAEVGSEWTER
jgi:gamma-glutamylaminecyclotransferase